MKGILHKTESGWEVKYLKYDMTNPSVLGTKFNEDYFKILPLHPNDAAGLFIQDTDSKNDGKEVEFEIVDEIIDLGRHGSTVVEKAKLVDKATRPLTETDAYRTRADQLREQVWEEIIREFYREAQQVEIGTPPLIFEVWLTQNYNPPTKKQD